MIFKEMQEIKNCKNYGGKESSCQKNFWFIR